VSGLLLPFAAIVAGLVSFSSPCCLPLVPGYLAYVSALPVTGTDDAAARRVTTRAALLFVGGFTLVFTLLGLGASSIGAGLLRNQDTITRGFGLVIIAMGLATAGAIRIPVLLREGRINLARVPRGPGWAFPFGMAFAAGWTPCIGPVLATVLATAAVSRSAVWGGTLLLLYSLGLGIPFVLLARGYTRAHRSIAFLKRHGRAVETTGGMMLVAVGVLFATGTWQSLFQPLQRWFAQTGWPPI
jgi:cytochrome c-type biogenesis protein